MTRKWTRRSMAWGATAILMSAFGFGVVFLIGLPGCSNQESLGQTQSAKPSGPSAKAGTDQLVRVKVVHPGPPVSTPQPAHIEPYEKTDIQAKVSGYVDAIGPALGPNNEPILDKHGKSRPWDIGDRVKTGQVLAELWVPEMKQELAQKAALVEKARADLGQATAAAEATEAIVEETASLVAKYEADVSYRKGEHKRYRDLYEQKAVQGDLVDKEFNALRAAEAAFTAAKNAVVTAQKNVKVKRAEEKAVEARLKVAAADLKHMEIMVDYATIRAPYDGIITRRLVDTRTFVQSAATGKAEPLFTVARDGPLRIVIDIPEAEAALVELGLTTEFQPNGFPKPLIGKVVRFADVLYSGTRTMRAEVELDAPVTTLRPGMFGSARIFPKTLTVPATAVVAGAKPYVLCVDKEGRVEQHEIELGYNDGVHIQVIKGLTAESQVITDGKDSIRKGQTVVIAN